MILGHTETGGTGVVLPRVDNVCHLQSPALGIFKIYPPPLSSYQCRCQVNQSSYKGGKTPWTLGSDMDTYPPYSWMVIFAVG